MGILIPVERLYLVVYCHLEADNNNELSYLIIYTQLQNKGVLKGIFSEITGQGN